ncbi:MAG: hypothetical protein JWL95_56 [Gemmatimonadetes bacterium]|nr:hypothetical protein [Gemmatimonadota bacterium]
MLQSGGKADLAPEALGAERVREVPCEHFEGDPPIVLPVERSIDHGHPTAADLHLDRVRIAKRPLQSLFHDLSSRVRGADARK